MGAHMKTTIEISDALLLDAKRLAAEQGVTLRQLVEQGLRSVLKERGSTEQFELRDASFGGGGLSAEAKRLTWQEILELSYEGRGG